MIQKIFIGPAAQNRHKQLKQFEAMALPLLDLLYSTAIRMTRHPLDAEDLVQDTYLKAWRYFDRFERGINFTGWILKILTNNFINDYRKRKTQPPRVDFETTSLTKAAEETGSTEPVTDTVLNTKYHDLFDDSVSTALDKLPEHFRMVILLADVNDLKYKEIADILHCPIGTVMSRLNRGRQMLARSLKICRGNMVIWRNVNPV